METVLLVENSAVFQAALGAVLRKMGFSVSVAPQRPHLAPDGITAVLIDAITLSDSPEQFELLVKEYSPIAPILLLAREDRAEQVVAGLRGGAIGFVKQTASPRELGAAIRTVATGRAWCDAGLLRQVAHYLPAIPALRNPRLTRREQEVLDRLKQGESNKEVAQRLGVTEQSVKVYVSNLLRKTGATNRRELAYLLAASPPTP